MKTQQKDKRKMLLVLPLLVLPFMALAFYGMGGGGHSLSENTKEVGINTTLPDASFKTTDPQNKLGYYQQSDRDSASGNGIKDVADRLGFSGMESDPQTVEINNKLAALNNEISRPTQAPTYNQTSRRISESGMGSDVDRLESLMRNIQQGNPDDPELRQLNGMLEKILDIQHPHRIRQDYINKISDNGDSLFKAIPAVVEESQKVTQGSVIKLRLLDTVVLNGQLIPKNHFIYGICDITNQRLILDIKNIRLGNSIVPVDLSVFDMDGMRGINVPEALTKDAVNGGTDDALRNIQLMTMDQSIATQVAGAGIDAAKGLFGKKIKRVKVRLKAGYKILLRNNKPGQIINH